MDLSDADIMMRVSDGEVALFDELVHRYQQPLLQVAWSKLGDRQWAEDVVQETFLAAYAARATYNPSFALRTWLWTILWNLCRRQWKRRAGRAKQITHDFAARGGTALSLEPASPDCGLTKLLAGERRQQVLAVIAQLPEAQADAIRLRFFGGLKYDEIAQTMDSALSTAKVRVRNGLLRLAKILNEQAETFETE